MWINWKLKKKSCCCATSSILLRKSLFCKKILLLRTAINGPTLILLSRRRKNKPYVSGCDTDTKKINERRKNKKKNGRVIFSALPTPPVLRFHEKKNLIRRRKKHVLKFDLAELNTKKKLQKSHPSNYTSHLLLFLQDIILDSICDGSGTRNRIFARMESPQKIG